MGRRNETETQKTSKARKGRQCRRMVKKDTFFQMEMKRFEGDKGVME